MVLWSHAKGWDFAPQRSVMEVPASGQEETTLRLVYRKNSGVLHLWNSVCKGLGTRGILAFSKNCSPKDDRRRLQSWPGQTPEGSRGHVKESYLTSNEKHLQSLEWLDLGFEQCLMQNRWGRVTRQGTGMAVRRLVCSPYKRQKPLGWARMVAVGRRGARVWVILKE